MIIKKWNSTNSTWEEQYPKTLETMIYDSNANNTPIFSNRKLKQEYLPDSVFGGMTFVGNISIGGSPTSPLELRKLITGTATTGFTISSTLDGFTGKTYPNDYDDIGQRYIGHYWIVSQNLGIFDANLSTEETDWATAAFDDGVAPTTSGVYDNFLSLEAGDWVIITGWDNTNNTFKVNVVSNTMSDATTSTKGVVELATDAEVTTGTSTNLIPSVKQLKDNYALVNHSHTEDEIDASKTWTYLNNGVGDSLTDVFDLIDADLSAKATSISTNATDIGNLENRKELFVQTDAPTANQANDIWFDI
jgi:hypothetical protein